MMESWFSYTIYVDVCMYIKEVIVCMYSRVVTGGNPEFFFLFLDLVRFSMLINAYRSRKERIMTNGS